MKTNISTLVAACVLASAAATGNASAGDGFVVAQDTLRSEQSSVELRPTGHGADSRIAAVRFSVDDADVEVTSIVLHWNNHPDDTLRDVGVIRRGEKTAATTAPGGTAGLDEVTVHYRILGTRKDATFQAWGYD